jgi:hypothetical protein
MAYEITTSRLIVLASPNGSKNVTLTVDDTTGELLIDNKYLSANVTITGNLTVNGTTAVIGSGAKQTNVDAGVEKQMSMDDDYLYICTHTGTTDAVWKKSLLFQT